MSKSSFHATNYGSFSGQIPIDLDGYAHTTQAAWMKAPMDWGSGDVPRSYRLERCKELAAQTRAAVKQADAALDDWRKTSK